MLLHLFLQGTLQLVRALKQFIHRVEVGDEFRGRLLAHTRTAREVVGRVAHQCQQVDDLEWGGDAIFLAHLCWAHHLVATTMARTIDLHFLSDQLPIVLVGRQHKRLYSFDGIGLFCQCTHHIVGLVAIHLQHRYAIGSQQFLDDGNGLFDVLGCGFALGLVGRKLLAAEGGAMGVEGHAKILGLLLFNHLLQGVHKADDGTCVESLGVDARVLDKCVVRPVNEGVSIEQKEFIHMIFRNFV